MKFLKKEIFYPLKYSKDNDELVKAQWAAYWDYIDTIKSQFPKCLLNPYYRTRFHDYAIKRISVFGDAWCYGKRSDVIELELRFDQIEYLITFNNVNYLKLLHELKDTCWHGPDGAYKSSPTNGLEEIALCELGITEDGEYSFEFLTHSGAIFEVHFLSVKVARRKIHY